jgi:hypothetical protein
MSSRSAPGSFDEQPLQDERDGDDRDVDQEHRPPPEVLEQEPAGHRAEGDSRSRDRRPHTDCLCPFGRVTEHVDEDRQCPGEDQCCTDPHQPSGGDQLSGGIGERGPRREQPEQHHADLHHALAAEPVSEPTTGQQETGEDERIGVDDPLQLARRGLELGGECGDRDVDDQVVDDHEEHRETEDRQDPPAAPLHGGVRVGLEGCCRHVDTVYSAH